MTCGAALTPADGSVSSEPFTTAADTCASGLAIVASLLARYDVDLASISCSALQTASFKVQAFASSVLGPSCCLLAFRECCLMRFQVSGAVKALMHVEELCPQMALPSG